MRKEELNQRSGFQFELIKLNIIANSAIMSYALSNIDKNAWVLPACPIISASLFSLWFHQAIVINIYDKADSINRIQEPEVKRTIKLLRISTFVLSMFINFCITPAVAILLIDLNGNSEWLNLLGWVSIVFICISLFFWTWFQYYKNH